MNKPYDGILITVEGGEGSGKSTLIEHLFRELSSQGMTVVKTREPGGTQLGEDIRSLLLKKDPSWRIGEKAELFLFLSARTQNMEEVILPALHQGKIVLCDRFNDSSIAYQGCARHLGMNYVEQLCELATMNLQPDCTLLLDMAPEESFKRLKRSPDRLENENLHFHREVRQGFLHLADKYPQRIKILNAALSEEEVFKEALRQIKNLFVKK